MVRQRRSVWMLALPVLLAVSPAWSATVASSPLYQVSPNTNQCLVGNPGTVPVKVGRVQLMNSGDTVLAQSPENLTIAPGTVYTLAIAGGGLSYCRVTNTSAKKIRLTHCVRQTFTASPCISVSTGH